MNLIVQCMNSPNEGGVDNVGDDTGFLAGLISGIYPGEFISFIVGVAKNLNAWNEWYDKISLNLLSSRVCIVYNINLGVQLRRIRRCRNT